MSNTRVLLLFCLIACCLTSSLFAGASAVNWVVVVNGKSQPSRRIANVYCRARQIPMRNVIVLDDVPDAEMIQVNTFREKILSPVLQQIQQRGLAPHVQGIAYSADFPTAIDLNTDLFAVSDRSPYLTPAGSINGMTYLFRFTQAKNPAYLGFESNWYARRSGDAYFLAANRADAVEKLKQYNKLASEMKHAECAELLEGMFKDLPTQFPLAYLAARHRAQANEPDKALRLLELAIQRGWPYADQMRRDPAFEKLRPDDRFQTLLQTCPQENFERQPPLGFNARAFWAPNGIPNAKEADGISYILSMTLAVTRGEGTTEEEAVSQLTRSIQADDQHPTGKFYFAKTDDVRTTTRAPNFDMAMRYLKATGYESEVVSTVLPRDQQNCLGVMIGTPSFQWNASMSTLAPGAIAENLTSVGAVMTEAGGQTKVTEFLRAGAAASSGTVIEPYAIQAKFPHPMMHAYYAQGFTLAEAFYLSVTGPYQLLIVGDPLCHPFGKRPLFETLGVSDQQTVGEKLEFEIQPKKEEHSERIAALEIYLDGKLASRGLYSSRVTMTTKDAPPGAHELRVVAIGESNTNTQYEKSIWLLCGGAAQQLLLTGPKSQPHEEPGDPVFQVTAPSGVTQIDLYHDSELVGTVNGIKGEITVPKEKLGRGPARLQAIGKRGSVEIASLPIVFERE